ncbi:MAG: phosphoglycolate phosphatase [Parcubacteria group bacterium]|nr:phosphoglycolate phosphatase [Parcubacteria group bacterium]
MECIDLNETQLAIFDWSGVVSDDRRPVYESNMRMLERRGQARMTFDEWLPLTTPTAADFIASQGYLENITNLNKEHSAHFLRIREEDELHPFIYPDAAEFFRGLSRRGTTIIVVSSHPTDHLLKEATEYGVNQYVQHFVGSASDKAVEIESVVKNYGMERARTIYVGDTVYDVQAARKARVVSVAMATGYHTADRLMTENPDYLFDNLAELGEALGIPSPATV